MKGVWVESNSAIPTYGFQAARKPLAHLPNRNALMRDWADYVAEQRPMGV